MTRANGLLYVGGLVLGASLVLGGCATQPTEEGAAQEMTQEEKARQAVADAEAAVEKNRSESGDWGLWKSTLGILSNAQKSLEQGDYQAATEAAKNAQFEAEMGLKQWREEQDEYKLAAQSAKEAGDFEEGEWTGHKGGGMAASEAAASGDLAMGAGGNRGTYTVAKGDTLWDIASMDEVYSDPFAWPLIYKNNSSKIDDPDLIFPNQKFTILMDVSDGDYNAAVRHAKTRGAWRLGETEASDLEYLEQ